MSAFMITSKVMAPASFTQKLDMIDEGLKYRKHVFVEVYQKKFLVVGVVVPTFLHL